MRVTGSIRAATSCVVSAAGPTHVLSLRACLPPCVPCPHPCTDCSFRVLGYAHVSRREHKKTQAGKRKITAGRKQACPSGSSVPGECASAHGSIYAVTTTTHRLQTTTQIRSEVRTFQIDRSKMSVCLSNSVLPSISSAYTCALGYLRPSRTTYPHPLWPGMYRC